jgi:hypothetical protein
VYVKDVFENSGRFSVTLDPTIDKRKVVRSRLQKRAQGKKRNKIEPIQGAEEGEEMQAQVVKVSELCSISDQIRSELPLGLCERMDGWMDGFME